MPQFHEDRGALHGITIVVDTHGPKLYVGRCDTVDDDKIVLMDADVHESSDGGASKAKYLEKAVKFGFWKKHDRIEVPQAEVASVNRLGEIDAGKAAPARPGATGSPPPE